MSQQNVEIVRRANEAFNRGDIEGCLAFYDEDVEVEDLMNAPDQPRVTRGMHELRQTVTAWKEGFDEFRGEIVELVEKGHHVVCVTDYYGKGREGPTMRLRVTDVVEVRDGKIVRGTFGYENRRDALEAVGLSAQDAHADS
jgi:ketosteroid isomerase-like protein